MRLMQWIAVMVVAGSCAPKGEPVLELTVFPKSVSDDRPIEVKVVATRADGKVGTGTVQITSDFGSLSTPEDLQLDSFGTARTTLICDPRVEPGCGDVRVKASWNSEGVTVTAEAKLTPSTSTGTGGGMGGGSGAGGASGTGAGPGFTGYANGMYFDGVDGGWIYEGRMLVTQGQFLARFPYSGGVDSFSYVTVGVASANPMQGNWGLTFVSPRGTDFGVGTYTDAERAPFRSDGKPGIEISGEGRACNTIAGEFEVVDFQRDTDGGIASLSITFIQDCERSRSGRLRGWIRVGH